jgi:hypothetical protein
LRQKPASRMSLSATSTGFEPLQMPGGRRIRRRKFDSCS